MAIRSLADARGTGSAQVHTVGKKEPVTNVAISALSNADLARDTTTNAMKRPRSPEPQEPNKSARIDEKTSVSSQPAVGKREIEFKATRVDEIEFKEAIARLQTLASSGGIGSVISKGSVIQEDHYLDHPIFKDTAYALYSKGDTSKSLRVRRDESTGSEKKQNHSFDVKVAQKCNTDSHERREYIAKIEDPEITLKAFEVLGFTANKIIKKNRATFLYENYEIVMDEIVGLKKITTGDFEKEFSGYNIEVELREREDDVKDVAKCLSEMKQFMETFLKVTKYTPEQSGMEKYM